MRETKSMPARITLTVTQSENAGQEFVFDERTTCIVGRSQDCYPRLVPKENPPTVSRHHCLFDINPPDIRIRDFGSLNGTFVNGHLIGRREKHQSKEEGAQLNLPEHDLKDGDEIRIRETVFRVSIYVPTVCDQCSAEIPDEQLVAAKLVPGVFRCAACRGRAKMEIARVPSRKLPRCAKCGKDVAGEIGEHRHGDYVCGSCKSDPLEILKVMLEAAKSGDKDLLSIEGYSIIRELGRGGFGAVYLARHDRSREQVALKVMLPEVAADERAKALFLREMRNTRALKHPNAVNLHDSGCSRGTFFCTLEFCEGGSVDKLMEARGGKLPLAEAAPIVLQALEGLIYAHHAEIPEVKLADGRIVPGRGLVHRDLKPHNIFLKGTGSSCVAKVADYGLSKAFDAAGLSGQTRSGTASGTPVFMPRQQVINFKYAKPDVDVWAMAASLYNMLTGLRPRDFPRGKDVWQTVLETSPVPIRQRDASIPRKLAELIDLALDDRKELHFKTAADFKRALMGAL